LETSISAPLILAKVWCRVAKLAAEDMKLTDADRKAESEKAYEKALHCLEKAKKAGMFKEPGPLKFYDSTKEFDPIRDKFKPRD